MVQDSSQRRAKSVHERAPQTAAPGPSRPARSLLSAFHSRPFAFGSRRVSCVGEGVDNAYLRQHLHFTPSWRTTHRGLSLPRRSTLDRTHTHITLSGIEDASALRHAQEPFVQPGYIELNPSYDQPQNVKPVWGLAKPLPRIVRAGTMPSKEEVIQRRLRAQCPAENSRRWGLDVDPNELELGHIDLYIDPRKTGAQVEDARVQREQDLVGKIMAGGDSICRRPSHRYRPSSDLERRSINWPQHDDHLTPVTEAEHTHDTSSQGHDDQHHHEHVGRHHHHHLSEVDPLSRPRAAEEANEPRSNLSVRDLMESAFPDDFDSIVSDLAEKEVHNNHTAWSVIRTAHREILAEVLGVFIQLTIGFCINVAAELGNRSNPDLRAVCWGIATMMAIYISGGVSGAHLNPAVTIMLWVYRGFPGRKVPPYFVAQFTGAICACFCAYALYYHMIHDYLLSHPNTGILDCFITSARFNWVTFKMAFLNEFIGTAIISITILALGDDQNAPPGAGMNALIIAMVSICLSLTFNFTTGASFNPSRDFGPRLALFMLGYSPVDLFTNLYWFWGPWAGCVGGFMAGAFVYDFMIFTGGESPVNYPVGRTRRVILRSARKWKRRCLRVKKVRFLSRNRSVQ